MRDYLRQLALEIINQIPETAVQVCTDGRKGEHNSCGSGIFIKAPSPSYKLKIKNPDYCSVYRSELVAIDVALNAIGSAASFTETGILLGSRSAI